MIEPVKRPSILFVEDEIELAENMRELLEDSKFKFIHSTKYIDAMVKTENQRFDCILTDINLDQGTGDALIDSIRNRPNSPNFDTPIIVLSSHIDQKLVKKVAGKIQGAFVKPYDFDEVLDKVNELLGRGADS